jgi:PAT family beta-lactamase induction signal transducer AmpG
LYTGVVRRDLWLLWGLYFVQGLPFGFQATAIPVILRERGASLTVVGFSAVLALPWLLKPLWAPIVDRYHSPRIGRRRSWLLPMQLLLALALIATALIGTNLLALLMAMVLTMNLFAATLDIAVDGLAVDVLRARDLGHGNTAQVVGYKLGMLTGGGVLLWLGGTIGERGVFAAMAAMVLAVMVATLFYREPTRQAAASSDTATLAEIVRTVGRALSARGGALLIITIATYKLGEALADSMFKPFVLDAGYSKEQIGLWIGTFGMLFSIAGSVIGGILATRWSFERAVALTAVARVVPLAGQWWLAYAGNPSAAAIIGVTSAEHMFGGALTTAMFALMMSRIDRRVGATHFTVLAAIEVLGKVLPSLGGGVVADSFGHAFNFALATLLSILFLGLLVPLVATSSSSSSDGPRDL